MDDNENERSPFNAFGEPDPTAPPATNLPEMEFGSTTDAGVPPPPSPHDASAQNGASVPPPPVPGVDQRYATPSSVPQPAAYTPPKKSRAGLVVGLVALAILLVAGVIISVLLIGRTSSSGDIANDVAGEVVEPGSVDEVVEEGAVEEGSDEVEADTLSEEDLPLGTVSDPTAEDVVAVEVADGEVDEIGGEIAANGFDSFTLELESGDTVEVTAQAGSATLDTILRAVDPDGEQVAGNDDADPSAGLPNRFDSQIEFTAASSGTYVIEVLGFDAAVEGPYLLTINRSGEQLDFVALIEDGSAQTGIEPFVEDQTTLDTGSNETESVEGRLGEPGAVDEYLLSLEAGERVRVLVEATGASQLDPVIEVFDSDFNSVGFNDDAESGLTTFDSELEFVAPVDDEYVFGVLPFGATFGDYTITIERSEGAAVEQSELADAPSSLFLSDGQQITVDGIATETEEAAFDLELERGDLISISVVGDAELDPIARLEFGGSLVAVNDDAFEQDAVPSGTDSVLVTSTAHTGIHTIVVRAFTGTAGGFTLTVQRN